MMCQKETEKERKEREREVKERKEAEQAISIRQRQMEDRSASHGTILKKVAKEDVRGCTCAGFAWTPATPPLIIQQRRRIRQSRQPLD